MISETLLNFLCSKTTWADIGNEKLLQESPDFGTGVGAAINEGRLIGYTKELSLQLDKMDRYKASLLSNLIGFACEREGDTSAGDGILKLFGRSCDEVYQMFKELDIDPDEDCPALDDLKTIYDKQEDWVRAYCGFNILCISTMAFLTRDASLRRQLVDMDIENQLQYLSEETPKSPYLASVNYVYLMLNTCHEKKLLVLFPEGKKGFFATANDLNNCFHLLFLLEEEIHKKLGAAYGMAKFKAGDSLIRLAHGEYPDDCWNDSYSTYFMECNYMTARHDELQADDINSLIWGEMPPDGIPEIDGRAVVVLKNHGINRSFTASFLAVPHEALRPHVTVERELSDAEYEAWLRRIRGM